MLKFVTNKLRSHSINENNYKDNEDHDSGTESDDEIENGSSSVEMPPASAAAATATTTATTSVMMDQRVCSISPADTGCSMGGSPGPDQQDAHSSEEELEVINSASAVERVARPLRSASSLPEKRKWSQRGDSYARRCSPENEENMSRYGNLSPPCARFAASVMASGGGGHHHHHHHHQPEDAVHPEHSSDEEVHALTNMSAPLQFRTSPPLEAVKPGRRVFAASKVRSLSPPSKLMHYEESPRKRSRHAKHAHTQRPYLDFEKMQQQLKASSVTTAWRHRGDQGAELALYCW